MRWLLLILLCLTADGAQFFRVLRPQPSSAPPQTNSLTQGIIAFWDFNSGADCADSVSGYVITNTASATYLTHAGMGRSAHFVAASSQYFRVGDNYDLNHGRYGVGTSDFTLSGWFKPTTASVTGTVLSKSGATWKIPGSAGVKSTELVVKLVGSQLQFTISTGGASTIVTNSQAIVSGTWYQFVAWYTASDRTLHLQVNNNTATTSVLTGGATTYPVIADGEWQIGRLANASQYFGGDIDAVGYWKRALTSDERAALVYGIPEWPFGLTPLPTLEVVRPLSNQLEPFTLGTTTGRVSVVTMVRNAADAIEYSYGGSSFATLASGQRGLQTNYFPANVGRTNLILRLASTPTATTTATNTGVGIKIFGAWQSNMRGASPTLQFYTGPTNMVTLAANDFTHRNAYWNTGAGGTMDPTDDATNQVHAVSGDGLSGVASPLGSYVVPLLTRLAGSTGKPIEYAPVPKGATSITNWTVALGSDSVECNHLDVTTLYGSMMYRILHEGGANFVISHGSETDMANGLGTNTFYVFCTNFNYQVYSDTLAYTGTGVTNLMCKVQHLSESGGALLVNQQALRTVMGWVWASPCTRPGPDLYGVSPALIDAAVGSGADGLHLRLQTDLDEAALRWSADGILFP